MALIVRYQSPELARLQSSLAHQLMESSQKLYKVNIKQFIGFIGDKPIWEITRDEVLAYRTHLLRTYSNMATCQTKFAVVKRLFAEALATPDIAERFTHDPTLRVDGISNKDQLGTSKHVALTGAQARSLINAVSNPRDRLAAILLLRTGLRRAELATLRVGMVQAEGPYWKIVVTGKGRKRRPIKIPDDVKEDLDRYIAEHMPDATPETPILVSHHANRSTRGIVDAPLSVDRIYAAIKAAGAACGMPAITVHSLRATFATIALENGAALQDVQAALGHADPRTTGTYNKRPNPLSNNAADRVRF